MTAGFKPKAELTERTQLALYYPSKSPDEPIENATPVYYNLPDSESSLSLSGSVDELSVFDDESPEHHDQIRDMDIQSKERMKAAQAGRLCMERFRYEKAKRPYSGG
ncbi:hypothetical protein FRC07_012079 [Ceratobasidium sp. 392]|nr:hypothetical protein FRC07_012079 [Ceratobasidium sp. 392]